MLPQEVLLCSVGPVPPSTVSGGVYLHDLQTGATLASFKQTSADVNCTAVVQTQHGQGGLVLAVQPDKALLNAYNFQKDQIMLRIAVPERLTCFSADREGRFCAGGTAQGRVYVWEIASGILFATFEAHYRRVTVARFSDDGAALATASEDSGISVWTMSSLLDNENQTTLPVPYWVLGDHTLCVPDVQFGMGAFPTCRLFSVSLDQTCKLWDLTTKTLLTTFLFPRPLVALVVERSERLFFAASADGHIHQMNLFRQDRDPQRRHRVEAVGGGGSLDVVRMDDADGEGKNANLIVTGQPLKSLAISMTSNLLLAGTADGSILLYDVPSHQLLRTIHSHRGLSINTLMTLLKPPDLLGHATLGLRPGEALPVRPLTGFQRIRDARLRERHEVPMLLLALNNNEKDPPPLSIEDQVSRYHADFLPGPLQSSADGASLSARVADLEAEVSRLRGQLGRAKGMNDAMWETVVRAVLPVSVSQSAGAENGTREEGGRRKRQRTGTGT